MKIKLLTILAVMLIAAGFMSDTSARTFTRASDGKTLEGEFIRMKDDKTASIKRANGQTTELPVALLTEADQAFIKEKAAAGTLEKEESLVTGKKIGNLAVAGRLLVEVHAEFMMSRTFEKNTVLNWYNLGKSGGGKKSDVGGNFGDFGLHVPHAERAAKYPHAVNIGNVPAAEFDANDIMQGNFVIEKTAMGNEDLAIEVWVQDKDPKNGEAIFGWQSEDGKQTSGTLTYPKQFQGSDEIQLITVNCTADRETWYLNGKKVSSGARKLRIAEGHKMVLGGASSSSPSFSGKLITVRLHTEALSEEEVRHNAKGGPMLGTDIHDWWRAEGDKFWWTARSAHFKHSLARKMFMKEIADREFECSLEDMDEDEEWAFKERVPGMLEFSEKIYQIYAERMALRVPHVSTSPKTRGDGIKYSIVIRPASGGYSGSQKGFGYGNQAPGFMNPHELLHGCQTQTGSTMGYNYWEVHANFPQTYLGMYQSVPPLQVSRVSMFFPANGQTFYHDRLMFEHLSQTPEYGPMFISKLWYDANPAEYPWTAFPRFDPDPSTDLGYEWTRKIQKGITWDYEIFPEDDDGEIIRRDDLYKKDGDWERPEMKRYAQTLLEKIPYDTDWCRPPKEMTPQQLGYNVCPMKIDGKTAKALLDGYISTKRGGDWRAAFVGVKPDGKPVYGDVVKTGGEATISTEGLERLYLVVCAVPTKILPIDMTSDFRSFEQEKFPYKLKLTSCSPLDVLMNETPTENGAPHKNGGGFVAARARVDATAYVGPHAQVLGTSQVLGNARIEDYAVVSDSTVRDNAIVSGHARVERESTVRDHAKVRDWGKVSRKSTVKDHAKVLEHATSMGEVCGGLATLKGVAVSNGSVTGNAMVDGAYAKDNLVNKGKWFTWSWGGGQEAGESDEDFGGVYTQMSFDTAHEWMAADDFGVTWGYLVGKPVFAKENGKGVLRLNGKDQFVELQNDVADMNNISMKADVTWQGEGDATIAEFSNSRGDRVYLGTRDGRCVFSISKGSTRQELKGPALKKGIPTQILVILSEDSGKLFINDKEAASNEKMTLNPDDVNATECYLGRGRKGNYFKGAIDTFEIYSVAIKDETPPTPNPAAFRIAPIFVNSTTAVMQSEEGVDPLGNVKYYFTETSGNPGGDDSGWIKTPFYKDTGLDPKKKYSYTVKMRDLNNNEGRPSAAASAEWSGAKVFRSTDGKSITMEAESYSNKIDGRGEGSGWKWEFSTEKSDSSGKGMMEALPDTGKNFGAVGYFEAESPRLDYLVDFPVAGSYELWMRASCKHANSDSVWAGIDMVTQKDVTASFGRTGWTDVWIDVKEPGVHTLSIWMREDGTMIDKFLITSDLKMQDITEEWMKSKESPRR